MTENSDPSRSPAEFTSDLLTSAWRSAKTVYYANTVSWRALKSGTLVFFGFFLWAGANILQSYWPSLTVLNYVMAYGFVLIAYGPFHHTVVIPYALKWRRRGDGRRVRIGRRLPNVSLGVFLTIVVVLGTFPTAVGPMTADFDAALDSSSVDINPDLLCTKATNGTTTEVHCHLTTSDGIARVTVESGGQRIAVDRNPPFDFTVRTSQMSEVVGEKQFQVILREQNGDVIRRYTRTVSMIEQAD